MGGMSAAVIPILPLAICSICGGHFHPRAFRHRLCLACYRWTVAGKHIAAAVQALKGAQ